MNKRVFVTVGTTKFNELIELISSETILKILKSLGYTIIDFQTGFVSMERKIVPGFELNYIQYIENFKEQIRNSDLVISHAGAGTCLDVLMENKPLIVVVNDKLMDNHQIELAEQLQKDNHLYWCYLKDLESTLLKDFSKLKLYPQVDSKIFSNYLNQCIGFI